RQASELFAQRVRLDGGADVVVSAHAGLTETNARASSRIRGRLRGRRRGWRAIRRWALRRRGLGRRGHGRAGAGRRRGRRLRRAGVRRGGSTLATGLDRLLPPFLRLAPALCSLLLELLGLL